MLKTTKTTTIARKFAAEQPPLTAMSPDDERRALAQAKAYLVARRRGPGRLNVQRQLWIIKLIERGMY
ncbi:MAG: hypothetical protein IIA66_13220 [Planctomycetes bacterium]|nr:hypothetical protein [Planctomycetota bacterium]